MLPKVYALDNGMRIIQGDSENYLGTFFLENAIYNELMARGYEVTVGKKYNGEIDFVAGKKWEILLHSSGLLFD